MFRTIVSLEGTHDERPDADTLPVGQMWISRDQYGGTPYRVHLNDDGTYEWRQAGGSVVQPEILVSDSTPIENLSNEAEDDWLVAG